jgi:hypothetical protein
VIRFLACAPRHYSRYSSWLILNIWLHLGCALVTASPLLLQQLLLHLQPISCAPLCLSNMFCKYMVNFCMFLFITLSNASSMFELHLVVPFLVIFYFEINPEIIALLSNKIFEFELVSNSRCSRGQTSFLQFSCEPGLGFKVANFCKFEQTNI